MQDGSVPEANRAVLGTADKRFLIGEQDEPPHLLKMAPQDVQTFLIGNVPNANRLIGAARGQLFSIRPEHQGTDPGAVPGQSSDFPAGGQIP